ncbi:MAG: hypothetical protein WD906_03730 [Anaerolineales bacterium]
MNAVDVLPSVAGALAAALTVLLDGRRPILIALAGLYLFLVLQLAMNVALPIALAKGVVGAAVVAILLRATSHESSRTLPSIGAIPTGLGFRVAATLLVLIPASGLVGLGVLAALPLSPAILFGSLWVMSLGALQMGLSTDTVTTTVGHLVVLCGFELLYVPLEPSLLLTVLLSAVHLGLALLGSYLISLSGPAKPT